jgi:hypothetical protein
MMVDSQFAAFSLFQKALAFQRPRHHLWHRLRHCLGKQQSSVGSHRLSGDLLLTMTQKIDPSVRLSMEVIHYKRPSPALLGLHSHHQTRKGPETTGMDDNNCRSIRIENGINGGQKLVHQ